MSIVDKYMKMVERLQRENDLHLDTDFASMIETIKIPETESIMGRQLEQQKETNQHLEAINANAEAIKIETERAKKGERKAAILGIIGTVSGVIGTICAIISIVLVLVRY